MLKSCGRGWKGIIKVKVGFFTINGIEAVRKKGGEETIYGSSAVLKDSLGWWFGL